MCKSRQRRDNITRHLLETHKIEKKGAKAVFRGFISFDSINWQPLYFEKGSEDPPRESSVMVPIKDGKITLYGVVFEVEQVQSDNLGDAESNNKEMDDLQDTELVKVTEQINKSARKSPLNVKGTSSHLEDFDLEDMESFGTPLQRQEIGRDRSSDIEKPAAARRLNYEELTDEFHEEETGENDATTTTWECCRYTIFSIKAKLQ